jgi:hypothetical protein
MLQSCWLKAHILKTGSSCEISAKSVPDGRL